MLIKTFPEMSKLLDILPTLPVGTASVERSFSQMKLVKTRFRNRITDDNVARLMRIAIEGPELTVVDFDKNFRHLQGKESSYYTVN